MAHRRPGSGPARSADRPAPARTPAAPGEITLFDRALITRLAHDGRAPYQTLANDLGVSLSTAKRRTELTRRGLLRFRCDFAITSADRSMRLSAPKNEKGAILRRPRLHHSHVKEWRAARDAGTGADFETRPDAA
ncbi:Lrp/AsnC family transcriptional regulator [Streptomyces sp. NBC_01320]|uniref:Lrp/AsnC family transcriptional regulator n=1 Tax=Streptomyces sp. NBC_01320 TaxID=2903824 RepID=UPI002E0FC716|nr:Lrp/AsnC family transcriptional regulator [Streptomyces sp. NBC_01320]